MGLKIKRVDLHTTGKYVKLEFEQSAASRGGEVVDSDNKVTIHKKPHDDLANAFIRMVPHLMFLTELASVKVTRPEYFDDFAFVDEPEFKGVNVTGIVISGKDRDMIKLLGTKTTSKKQVIPLNAPVIWLEDNAENRYVLGDILRSNFSKLMDEAEKYHQGKYAVEEQEVLF